MGITILPASWGICDNEVRSCTYSMYYTLNNSELCIIIAAVTAFSFLPSEDGCREGTAWPLASLFLPGGHQKSLESHYTPQLRPRSVTCVSPAPARASVFSCIMGLVAGLAGLTRRFQLGP